MSAPKSGVSSDQDESSSKVSSHDNNQFNSPSVASIGSTPSPRPTFKAAFFNFLRDFKKNHRNKDYQTILHNGSKKWRTMTQAQRAPYILEAARNRDTSKEHPKSKRGEKRKSRQETAVPKKRAKTEGQVRPGRTKSGRCAACGKRRKESRPPSKKESVISSTSLSTKSTKSAKSAKSKSSKSSD